MARLTFKRLLFVGVAVAAGAAYAKREQVRQLLPGGSSPSPERVLASGAGSVQLRRAGAPGQHRHAGARARAGGDAGPGRRC